MVIIVLINGNCDVSFDGPMFLYSSKIQVNAKLKEAGKPEITLPETRHSHAFFAVTEQMETRPRTASKFTNLGTFGDFAILSTNTPADANIVLDSIGFMEFVSDEIRGTSLQDPDNAHRHSNGHSLVQIYLTSAERRSAHVLWRQQNGLSTSDRDKIKRYDDDGKDN
jgi:hypothetical protein